MIWFTSDTHFNHANIIKYCNRPFRTVSDMNEAIIENWNTEVARGDTVYHLGDFGFGDVGPILQRLNGNIILIQGSHDKPAMRYRGAFQKVTPLLEITVDGNAIVLCHYAMRVWSKSHYNSWHLFGHSHGHLSGIGKSFDVGVDCHAFRPYSFGELTSHMDNRPDNPNVLSPIKTVR